jgi:hypothetical protein
VIAAFLAIPENRQADKAKVNRHAIARLWKFNYKRYDISPVFKRLENPPCPAFEK